MKSYLAQWLIQKFSKWLLYEPPIIPSYLYDFERIQFEVRPGDVLLVEGLNRVSRIIKQITHSTWSHSTLYIGRLCDMKDPELRAQIRKYYSGSPEEQLVIESMLGRGTIVTPLSRYKDHMVRICRPRGISRSDSQKVIAYAIHHLGMRYSIRHVLDLARFLLPWGIMPRRWRSCLFVHNALKPTEEICSSLIASAFQSVNFPILPEIVRDSKGVSLITRNPRLYTPKDFDYSPFFDVIKYPMLPLGEGTYRHLHWRSDTNSEKEFTPFPKNVPDDRLITDSHVLSQPIKIETTKKPTGQPK